MPYTIYLSWTMFAELVLACILVLGVARRADIGRALYLRACAMAGTVAVRLSQRRWAMIALAGLAPVVIRVVLLPILPVPQPYIMEEFNHLFMAATYDTGRVANPTHALGIVLQTYQQIDWPSNVSARPPLSPIFLYIGQAAFGSPFAGSLVAIGLTSAALCWSLLGWTTARLAALGSFLAILTFCVFGYWVNSYWAPTPIALGGALLFGAVPRIEQRPTIGIGLVCVVALFLLAGTRPYENGVYAAVICGWLAYRFIKKERRALIPRALLLVVLPMALGVGGIVAAQMWYNAETTGNIALMPYQIWRESQGITPMFLWQPIEAGREFYHAGSKQFAMWNRSLVQSITEGGFTGFGYLVSRHGVTFRDLLGPFLFLGFACWSPSWIGSPKTEKNVSLYLGAICFGLITLALCGVVAGSIIKLFAVYVLIRRWANERERLAVLVLLVGMVATSLPSFYMNIYFAAYTAPMLLLAVTGLPKLARWSRPLGPSLAGFAILGVILVAIGQTGALLFARLGAPMDFYGPPLSRFELVFDSPHHDVRERLEAMPGQHVVFVQMGAKSNAIYDPTWNAPDIDAQKVVWVRDLTPEWTAKAQEYYAGRQFWLIKIGDAGAYTFEPFEPRVGVSAAPVERLPTLDRVAAERIGARIPSD